MQAPIPGQSTLAVVGLGYVGFTLATAFAAAGFDVLGFDKDPRRRLALQQHRTPFDSPEPELEPTLARAAPRLNAANDWAQLAGAAVVFVCVDTPIEADRRPRFTALRDVLANIGAHLAPRALVVVESTLAPGTMRTVVIPALEASTGGTIGERFHVGHCPERVTAGRLLGNLRDMPRVCGASSHTAGEAMIALYKHIVRAELDVTDLETAELVKTAENAYRDVAIAFANELALICERAGGDFSQVRRLVNKVPGRDVLFAGAGVGGHCIPKDSWLLAHGAPEVEPWLLSAARRRNDAMPDAVLARVEAVLGTLRARKLVVLGYTYREDTDDVRDSPSAAFVARAREAGAEVAIHDPYVPAYAAPLTPRVADADALVLLVGHRVYTTLPFAELGARMRTRLWFDARNLGLDAAASAAGFAPHRLGLDPRRSDAAR